MASPQLYRRRLINAINTHNHHIVYVYGPSGFGKTVLAQHWMEGEEKPTAWVEGYSTSNATELFKVFLKEISAKVPQISSKLKKLEEIKDVTLKDIEEFAQILEADKTPFNIVIDNAEEIRRSHNALSLAIVRNMPRHIKLVLVTTTTPRAEFIREAGIKRFAVIDSEELRFTAEEIKLLASEILEDISDKEVKEIAELTDGWPASTHIVISLLGVEPQLRKELSALRFKGKRQFAVEANRVLAKLEAAPRSLLEKVCLLKNMNPDLIFSLTQDVDALRILTLLSQETVIISQTGMNPPQFKLNPIFRDVLIDNLRHQDGFNEILEKTLEMLLSQNEVRQATSILIEIGETARLNELLRNRDLLDVINASIQDSIIRGAAHELKDWLSVTPYLSGEGSIGELVITFYVNLLSLNFKVADAQILMLESTLNEMKSEIAQSWHGDLLALKSILAYAKGELEKNWNLAMQAYEEIKKKDDYDTRHQVTFLQLALWGAVLSDEYEKIDKFALILDELSQKKQSPQRMSNIASMRSLLAAHEGRLIEAQNYLITPQSSLSKSSVKGFFGPYGSRLSEAIVSGEAGNIDASISLLKENFDEALSAGNYPIAIGSLGRAGYYLSLLRKGEDALGCIERAREVVDSNQLSSELHAVVDIWEIRVRHFMMDQERVRELLKRCKPSYFVRSFQAAASIANGNLENTKKIIESFDLNIPRQAITYYLFEAYTQKDAPALQLKSIGKAVEIGSKHGYFYHFVTQRSDILQQFITLASESPTAFNERLARAAGEELSKMMTMKSSSGDALTRREADILRHLATGLPLKEIAANLNISKNTIKTHLRNLYKKLGAEDRKDAVEKGKNLLRV